MDEISTNNNVPAPAAQIAKPAKVKKTHTLGWLILCLLLIAAGAGAYYYRDNKANLRQKDDQLVIAQQAEKIKTLETAAAAKADTTTTTTSTDSKAPSAQAAESIKSSITSNNTAALEGYMASKVTVIIAASEGIGERTPTQAISDLKYLDNATDPWDFNLSAATLTKFQTGDYKKYFPTNAIVGKSANKYVISFNFDSEGKIDTIFMAVNSDLL